MKKPESICIFGDSTAWGAWDIDKGGWVNRLWQYVGKRDDDYVEIYNLSVSGGTTEDIIKRFENESILRKADALFFQTGGNDASYKTPDGQSLVSIEKFKANIEEIIIQAKKITDYIIFCDLKNCDESKTLPIWWDELYFSNERMAKYNTAMKEVCEKHNVLYVHLPNLENEEFDERDGLHPNARGHEKIFLTVKDFLEKHNWI